jgi:pilus assembly protein CpaF
MTLADPNTPIDGDANAADGNVIELPVFARRPGFPGVNPHAKALQGLAGDPGPANIPHPISTSPLVETVPAELDWRVVASMRRRAGQEIERRVEEQINTEARRTGLDPVRDREVLQLGADERQELGRQVITEVIDDADADATRKGEGAYPITHRELLAKTLFDAIFGLGRLQPLLDDPTITNIVMASGYDRCFVYRDDGAIERIPPIVESDEDLIDMCASLAAKGQGGNARPFSPAVPDLHLRLPDGSRLAASAWVTPRPSVVIRCHRLKTSNLEDLVDRGSMTALLGSFLAAAVSANLNIIVSGAQGAGKTTLVRALCGLIPPYASIALIETNAELFLNDFPDRHWIVHAWEERPGMGEIGPDGHSAGEFTLSRALSTSQRFQADRTIVGEVRGPEIWTLIKAMESGGGGMCTTHAARADAAIGKLVTCAMEFGRNVTAELATLKLAGTVDLVVQLGVRRHQLVSGALRIEHWVEEVLAVGPGEGGGGLSTTRIFGTEPGGRVAYPDVLPDHLSVLQEYGFDIAGFLAEGRLGRTE